MEPTARTFENALAKIGIKKVEVLRKMEANQVESDCLESQYQILDTLITDLQFDASQHTAEETAKDIVEDIADCCKGAFESIGDYLIDFQKKIAGDACSCTIDKECEDCNMGRICAEARLAEKIDANKIKLKDSFSQRIDESTSIPRNSSDKFRKLPNNISMRGKKFVVKITTDGKYRQHGSFNTLAEAKKALKKVKAQYNI